MKIGGLKPSNNVFLAPMAGVTDLPMRELAMELGAGLAVGEMVSDDASLADSRKTRQRQRHSHRAGLRSVQIVGHDPSRLAKAAHYNVELGAEIIDINMGCPAKKVCKKAAGSALLADELLVGRILTAVVEAVDVPITLKIRTGTDHKNRNGVSIARIAEDAGIQMLTVHGRTRADRFNGNAEYQTISQIVNAVSIPVIANGDIVSLKKARRVLAETDATGVMIGRAAQGQLWLPGAIAEALKHNTADIRVPTPAEQLAIQHRHSAALHDFYGDYLGPRIVRKHHAWFLESLREQSVLTSDVARELRRAFNTLVTPQAQLDRLAGYTQLFTLPHEGAPGARKIASCGVNEAPLAA